MITLGTREQRTVISTASEERYVKRHRLSSVEEMQSAGFLPRFISTDALKKAADAGRRAKLTQVDVAVQKLGDELRKSRRFETRPDHDRYLPARREAMVRRSRAQAISRSLQVLRRQDLLPPSVIWLLTLFSIETFLILDLLDFEDDLQIVGTVVFDHSVTHLAARDVTLAPGSEAQFQGSYVSMRCRSIQQM